MRCQDLTRQLALGPAGDSPSAEVAEHLASCPGCSEWSRRVGHFDRIWEATRPVEPSMDALDALWARASAELDAREDTPATIPFRPSGRRRRWAMAGMVAAQAAAVLVASLVLLRREAVKPVDLARAETPELLHLKVDDDEMTIVRIPVTVGGRHLARVERQDLSYVYASPVLPADSPLDQLNAMEALASTSGLVASQ